MTTTTTMQLASAMEDCPVCWENFVLYCQLDVLGKNEYYHVGEETFTQELRPYGARVHLSYDDNYVEFDSEAGMTMFMLRFA